MTNASYDLAKKLKDAGFPQHQEYDGITREEGGGRFYAPILNGDTIKWVIWGRIDWLVEKKESDVSVWVYIPNLSELIEACEGGYFDLCRSQEGWQSRMGLGGEWYFGSSPEESVANLWLALNS